MPGGRLGLWGWLSRGPAEGQVDCLDFGPALLAFVEGWVGQAWVGERLKHSHCENCFAEDENWVVEAVAAVVDDAEIKEIIDYKF